MSAVRAALALALTAALLVPGGPVAGARPTQTIAQVSALLDQLSKQNEQVDERYNTAMLALQSRQHAAARAAADARSAARDAARSRDLFRMAAEQRYESGALDPTALLFSSAGPQAYLDDVSSQNYLASQFATMSAEALTAAGRASAERRRAAADVAAAREQVRAVRAVRTDLEARTAHFTAVLKTLNEQQRRRYEQARQVALAKARAVAAAARAAQAHSNVANVPVAQTAPAAPTVPSQPVGSAVAQVIAFAEAQVGKPYVFGAAGPGAYDCSGLTMASWAKAGVQLPHSAAAQYGYGHHVGYDQLQPGDLIFLYRPIGHVELYVGNDLAVSAANPATGIVYVHPSRDLADYVGATRLSG